MVNFNQIFDTALCMTFLYLACAGVCLCAENLNRVSTQHHTEPGNRWRWRAVLLLAMAPVALLQLDAVFVLWVRELAKTGGWYELRRPLQIGVLLIVMGSCLWATRIRHRASQKPQKQPTTKIDVVTFGLSLLIGLLVLRFVSFHYTDQVLYWRLLGFRLGRLAELAGLILVMLGGVQLIVGRS